MSSPSDDSISTQSDFLLTASLYYRDELPEPERAAFELQLSRDDVAQNALVEAVLIEESLLAIVSDAAAQPVLLRTIPVTKRGHSHGWSRAAAVMASVIVIGLMFAAEFLAPADRVDEPALANLDDVSAISLWSQISENESHAGTEFPAADVMDESLLANASEELTVPEWMYVLVEVSQNDAEIELLQDDEEETL